MGYIQEKELHKFVDACLHENAYTPDMSYLMSRFEYVPVFVYGTEKKNFSDHCQMNNMPRFGFGFTALSSYALYRSPEGPPVGLECWAPYAGRLNGEVYLVDPATLVSLDEFHENLIFSKRLMRKVNYTQVETKDKTLPEKGWFQSLCWMYLGEDIVWNARKNAGELRLVEMIMPKNADIQPYYLLKPTDDLNFKAKTQRNVL